MKQGWDDLNDAIKEFQEYKCRENANIAEIRIKLEKEKKLLNNKDFQEEVKTLEDEVDFKFFLNAKEI